jgi:hypothetical protein
LRIILGLFSSFCSCAEGGWLVEEPEDNEDAPLGRDGGSLLGGLSENDFFGGTIVAGAPLVLIPIVPAWLVATNDDDSVGC